MLLCSHRLALAGISRVNPASTQLPIVAPLSSPSVRSLPAPWADTMDNLSTSLTDAREWVPRVLGRRHANDLSTAVPVTRKLINVMQTSDISCDFRLRIDAYIPLIMTDRLITLGLRGETHVFAASRNVKNRRPELFISDRSRSG